MTWICSTCGFWTRDGRDAFQHRDPGGGQHHISPVPERQLTGIEKQFPEKKVLVMQVAK